MKHFKDIFRTFLTLLLLLPADFLLAENSVTVSPADNVETTAVSDPMDSVEVSLITCSPHEEIYSLYGHTALRWHETGDTPRDIAFNYGVFDFKRPHFILRFVFGITDYELGSYPFDLFCAEYARWGCQVSEQVLNLTNAEKRKLRDALAENLRPENRVYRYNFLYNNCSTKPRDLIELCLDSELKYEERDDFNPTFREMIHEHTLRHPWAAFGNDLLLGVRADMKTNRREQEFLPENLMYDFGHARIVDSTGVRPLVSNNRVVLMPGVQVVKSDFPLSPTECALLLALVSLAVIFYEYHHRRTLVWWDALLMLFTGAAGVVILAMFFSQHPTTSTNLQLLLLNPLPLFFLPAVLRRRPTRWWTISAVLLGAFLVGGAWQDYAEGTEIVALCLLTRIWSNYRYAKQQ